MLVICMCVGLGGNWGVPFFLILLNRCISMHNLNIMKGRGGCKNDRRLENECARAAESVNMVLFF